MWMQWVAALVTAVYAVIVLFGMYKGKRFKRIETVLAFASTIACASAGFAAESIGQKIWWFIIAIIFLLSGLADLVFKKPTP